MHKKIFIVIAILCVAAVVQVHAIGLGAQLNFSVGGDILAPGFSVVICPSERQHIAVNWFLDLKNDDSANIVGLTWDLLPLRLKIVEALRFNLGVGFYANLVFAEDPKFNITGGIRFPVGLSFLLGNNFEIYTHVAPSLGIDFLPKLTFERPFFPIALGAKVWLGRR